MPYGFNDDKSKYEIESGGGGGGGSVEIKEGVFDDILSGRTPFGISAVNSGTNTKIHNVSVDVPTGRTIVSINAVSITDADYLQLFGPDEVSYNVNYAYYDSESGKYKFSIAITNLKSIAINVSKVTVYYTYV